MYWIDAWKFGESCWANSIALAETATASGKVVERRGRKMEAAMRNPIEADLGELGRIVPEKIAAFSQAGAATCRDMAEIQTDLLAQGLDLTRLFIAGWPPSSSTVERIARRGSRLALKISRAGGHALAPIHDAAVANERRLR